MTVIPFRHRKGSPAGIGGQFKEDPRAQVDIPLDQGFGALSADDAAEAAKFGDDYGADTFDVAAMYEALEISRTGVRRVGEPDLAHAWMAYGVQGSVLVPPERWAEAVVQAKASKATPYHGIVSPGLHYTVDFNGGDAVSKTVAADGSTTYARALPGGGMVSFTEPRYTAADERGRPWSDGEGCYRHSVGDRAVKEYRRASEIAKDVRADIAAAVAVGYLPDNLTYSVTSKSFAGGQSVDVTVKGWSDADRNAPQHVLDEEGRHPYERKDRVAVRDLEQRVKAIAGRYNDGCNMGEIDYFNNDYYCDAYIQDDAGAAFEAREKARKARRTGR